MWEPDSLWKVQRNVHPSSPQKRLFGSLTIGVTGRLPQGSVGLVLGRASTSAKGIIIYTGLINSDSVDEIKLIVSAKVPVSIPDGESIAQLLLLPNTILNKGDKTRSPEMGSGSEKAAY